MDKDVKIAIIIGSIIIAILIVVPLVWGGLSGWGGGWGMMGPGMMGGFGWGGFMGIGMVIFWGLVIWGIVALARGVGSPGGTGPSNQSDSALEVLKRRYARGEINKEEFEDKKKDIV